MNNSDKKTGFRHFCQATAHTCNGLKLAIGESAFRQELLGACLLVPAAWLLPFPFWLALLLSLLWGGLLVVEILNTAIEAVVDLASPEYHLLAKKAKDLGSAAVGISLTMNIFAWIMAICQMLIK